MIKKKTRMTIFLISISIALLLTVFRIIIPFIIINKMANMHVDFKEIYKAEDFGIEADHFFVTTDDGFKISAYEVEAANPKAVVICLSGIHDPSATAYMGHAKLFRQNGYATIFFDMRAHGESDGDMICMGYREHLDTKAIVNYIEAKPEYKNIPIVIMGLDMGASTAIISAGELPEIDGLIAMSAFSSWEDIFCDKMAGYSTRFFARLERPFVLFSTAVKYRVDSKLITPLNGIKRLGTRPALIMHSKEDSQVPYENFERIVNSAPSQIETFTREGDLHLMVRGKFTEPEKDTEYASVLIGFLEKNFGKN